MHQGATCKTRSGLLGCVIAFLSNNSLVVKLYTTAHHFAGMPLDSV